MLMFNHGPPEEILKTNLKNNAGSTADEDEDDLPQSEIAWRKFIKDNNYVAIGSVWDACGKIILSETCLNRILRKPKTCLNQTALPVFVCF